MIGPDPVGNSWALLRLEGKALDALGCNRPGVRAREFACGFLITGAAAALRQLGYAWASSDAWRLNPELTGGGFVHQVRWTINSVLYEELLFRGYLLYVAGALM